MAVVTFTNEHGTTTLEAGRWYDINVVDAIGNIRLLKCVQVLSASASMVFISHIHDEVLVLRKEAIVHAEDKEVAR